MKIILSACIGLLTLAATAVNALADTIVMKDGTTKTVYNVEEAGEWILYTDGVDKNSALHRIAVAEVFAIKSDDGQMRTVGASTQPAPAAPQPAVQDNAVPAAPKMIPPVAHPDNKGLIDQCNSGQFKMQKPKDKIHSGYVMTGWGIGRESVMADSLVQIGFEQWQKENAYHASVRFGYKVAVYNNSDAPVYIDLTNSFRIIDGMATPFYDGATYTQNSGGSKGGSLNVGALAGALGVGGALGTLASGVNVGGGTSSGTSVTTTDQPILVVPPHSRVYLPQRKMVDKKDIIELCEPFYWANTDVPFGSARNNEMEVIRKTFEKYGYSPDSKSVTAEAIQLKKNQEVVFTEDKSPKEYGYRITYSTRPDFAEYTTLPVKVFLQRFLGQYWYGVGVPAPLLVGYGDIRKK